MVAPEQAKSLISIISFLNSWRGRFSFFFTSTIYEVIGFEALIRRVAYEIYLNF